LHVKSLGNVDFLRSLDGRAWYSDDAGIHLLPAQETAHERPLHANARRPHNALFDRQGHLWTIDAALAHYAVTDEAPEVLYKGHTSSSFTARDGLTSNLIRGLLEDVEGNIWTITAAGVDRFRPTNVHKIALRGGDPVDIAPAALAAGPDGAV